MKAIVYKRYGTTRELQLRDVDIPLPKDNEILVKVHAAALNHSDVALLAGKPFFIRLAGYGVFTPKFKILASDISGVVEAVGKDVEGLKSGDEVFGDASDTGLGGLAEYVCVDQKYFVTKPPNLSHEDAAAAPMASMKAWQALKKAGIQSGHKVLINGASGGVGSYALQIAKAFGAEVTAVCSTQNVERAKDAGAEHVIDYTKEGFTKTGWKYDVIIGANGYNPIKDYINALNKLGTYVMIGGTIAQMFEALFLGPFLSKKGGKTITSLSIVKWNKEDLDFVKSLLENGKIASVIDRCYPLEESPEAFRYMIEGHARGKVIITLT